METFLDFVSDFASEEMAAVLHMEQESVKMCVRYKNHDYNVYHFNCRFSAVPIPEQAKKKMVTLPSNL
jgi:hypothetical protein